MVNINISIFEKLINPIIVIVPVLIGTAFFTLAERKVLASIQRRVGPVNTGFYGILQPIADGIKLLIKMSVIPLNSNKLLWLLNPFFSLWFSFLGWYIINSNSGFLMNNFNYNLLYIFMISSCIVYSVFLAGWYSKSQFSILASLRTLAQLISYEITMSLIILPLILLSGSLNLNYIVYLQTNNVWFLFLFLPCAIIYFICLLAETNRIPFDLLEAEAELVAGYQTEFSGFWFAAFFLSEYSTILCGSSSFVIIFCGGSSFFVLSTQHYSILLDMIFFLKVLLIVFIIIFLRGNLPRYRFDNLMIIGWKILIPLILGFLFFYLGIALCIEMVSIIQEPWSCKSHCFLLGNGSYF